MFSMLAGQQAEAGTIPVVDDSEPVTFTLNQRIAPILFLFGTQVVEWSR